MRHSREGVKLRARRAAAKAAPRASAPGLKQRYLDVLGKEVPVTLKVMKAYPSEHSAFKPHDRSHSALRLLHTFAMENGLALDAVRGNLTMPPRFLPEPATLAEAITAYERSARALFDAVAEAPESRLRETVAFFTGPGRMDQVPVHDVLWLMLMDSVHHRGQLAVYLRMAGGKVPSIYGPSADEPWM
jgi:hypothetical protein